MKSANNIQDPNFHFAESSSMDKFRYKNDQTFTSNVDQMIAQESVQSDQRRAEDSTSDS